MLICGRTRWHWGQVNYIDPLHNEARLRNTSKWEWVWFYALPRTVGGWVNGRIGSPTDLARMWMKEWNDGATDRGQQCWPSQQIEVGGNVVWAREILGQGQRKKRHARQKDGKDISQNYEQCETGSKRLIITSNSKNSFSTYILCSGLHIYLNEGNHICLFSS